MRRLEEHVSIKESYCPRCLSEDVQKTEVVEVLEAREKHVEEVEYWLPQIICKECGVSAAFEAVNAMHDAACFAQNLITPSQIKNIRKKYQMNTKAFAELTGISETTIKRWESRAFYPNRSDTTLIKLIGRHGPDIVYDLRADEQINSGDVPMEVKEKAASIFKEVAKNDPTKLENFAAESHDMLKLLA